MSVARRHRRAPTVSGGGVSSTTTRSLVPSSVTLGHVTSAGDPSKASGSSPKALDISGTDATTTSPS